MEEQTIAAISTAYGESGIGIVRMSGPRSGEIAQKIFKGRELTPRYMHYGKIVDPASGSVLDEVLCVYMKAPNTYTGEDVVEIQCHGSLLSLKNILALCIEQGAELADKGEFTKRAFLNGRMDLSQAEAVIDLIKAKTERSFDAALDQMEGKLSKSVRAIRDELKELLIQITVNMDYPDEDIEEITYGKIEESLLSIGDKLSKLLKSTPEGKILREGLAITIVGKPNVGKSSLMNIFLNEDRSIVTDIPGTTRDTIEEQASFSGIPVRLTDTAGIHDSSDKVEAIGIERSKAAFASADLLLLILDASRPLDSEDELLLNEAADKNCIVVLNKQDLKAEIYKEDILSKLENARIVKTSFINDEGIDILKKTIEEMVGLGNVKRENDVLVTNVRHADLLKKAKEETDEALLAANSRDAIDFIEINVKAAFDYLGEITGDTASGEIIDEIFSRFCLGK